MSATILPEEAPPPFPPEQCRGETCVHRPRHNMVTDMPEGPPCGRAAVQVIFWDDGRFSPACGAHGRSWLAPEALDMVLCVHPIEPPIEVSP